MSQEITIKWFEIFHLLRSLASFLARLSSIIRGLLSLQASEAVELISLKLFSTTYLIFWTAIQVFTCCNILCYCWFLCWMANWLNLRYLGDTKYTLHVKTNNKTYFLCLYKLLLPSLQTNNNFHVFKILKDYIQHVWPINRVCWVRRGRKSCCTKHQKLLYKTPEEQKRSALSLIVNGQDRCDIG